MYKHKVSLDSLKAVLAKIVNTEKQLRDYGANYIQDALDYVLLTKDAALYNQLINALPSTSLKKLALDFLIRHTPVVEDDKNKGSLKFSFTKLFDGAKKANLPNIPAKGEDVSEAFLLSYYPVCLAVVSSHNWLDKTQVQKAEKAPLSEQDWQKKLDKLLKEGNDAGFKTPVTPVLDAEQSIKYGNINPLILDALTNGTLDEQLVLALSTANATTKAAIKAIIAGEAAKLVA